MLSRRWITLGTLVTLVGATVVGATSRAAPTTAVVRLTSGTPGHEVRFRAVLLVRDQPMRVVEETTPFEVRPDGQLVLGAFEPVGPGAMLRVELVSETPAPAVVTAPRVLVGQHLGGVATEFVQAY
jgi:hypothetical protein